MRRRWLPAIVAGILTVLVLGLLGVLALGFGTSPGQATVTSGLVGKPAPDFSLPSLSGGRLTLKQFRGHTVVLNFWASWCVPCSQEHPYLIAAYRKYTPNGVQFIGISLEDPVSEARSFMKKHGGAWPIVSDSDGATAVAYGVTGPPETFIIDRRGIIRYHLAGPVYPGSQYTPSVFDAQIGRAVRGA